MATGSVSALDQDTWQLIQTNATTSGTTSTFSNLSGYKKYLVTWEGVGRSGGGGVVSLKFNSSSSNYFGGVVAAYNGDVGQNTNFSEIRCTLNGVTGAMQGFYLIENTNSGAPVKTVKGEVTDGNGNYIQETRAGWINTDEITSIVFSSAAFNAGSMKLYGIAG